MRPITQPYKQDIIILDALSLLLNVIFENIFQTFYHGFRKEKGALTFFAHIEGWEKIFQLIKADIVGCFDNIDHALPYKIPWRNCIQERRIQAVSSSSFLGLPGLTQCSGLCVRDAQLQTLYDSAGATLPYASAAYSLQTSQVVPP